MVVNRSLNLKLTDLKNKLELSSIFFILNKRAYLKNPGIVKSKNPQNLAF